MIPVPRSWRATASRAAPRVAALLWAAYDLSRVLAYVDSSPPQLSAVSEWMPLWIPWAVATTMLVLGGLVPTGAAGWAKRHARWLRQWGMTITLSTLTVWGVAFLVADFSRGWVTAGSYLMLAGFALACGWVASREVASVRAVREGEAHARLADPR